MNFKQCPGCKSMVAESKAFCSDCDTPMDVEQKRHDSSEFDSLMKTQNLSSTTQFRLFEQINLSSFFNYPRPDATKFKAVETEANPIQSNGTENQAELIQSDQVDNLEKPIHIIQQPEAKIYLEPPTNLAVEPQDEPDFSVKNATQIGNVSYSRKTIYVVGGIILVFLFFVISIVAAIFSIFYFNLLKLVSD